MQQVQQVTVAQLRELRNMTGAGMMDCRAALEATNGHVEQAATLLRENAAAEAARRASRAAPEGLVGSYVHHNRKLAALVELRCETDFVARTDVFRTLLGRLAEHVAASAPEKIDELLAQPWVREPSRTIADLIDEASATLGERVELRRFVRFDVSDVRA
jgi:elongation factor Ts